MSASGSSNEGTIYSASNQQNLTPRFYSIYVNPFSSEKVRKNIALGSIAQIINYPASTILKQDNTIKGGFIPALSPTIINHDQHETIKEFNNSIFSCMQKPDPNQTFNTMGNKAKYCFLLVKDNGDINYDLMEYRIRSDNFDNATLTKRVVVGQSNYYQLLGSRDNMLVGRQIRLYEGTTEWDDFDSVREEVVMLDPSRVTVLPFTYDTLILCKFYSIYFKYHVSFDKTVEFIKEFDQIGLGDLSDLAKSFRTKGRFLLPSAALNSVKGAQVYKTVIALDKFTEYTNYESKDLTNEIDTDVSYLIIKAHIDRLNIERFITDISPNSKDYIPYDTLSYTNNNNTNINIYSYELRKSIVYSVVGNSVSCNNVTDDMDNAARSMKGLGISFRSELPNFRSRANTIMRTLRVEPDENKEIIEGYEFNRSTFLNRCFIEKPKGGPHGNSGRFEKIGDSLASDLSNNILTNNYVLAPPDFINTANELLNRNKVFRQVCLGTDLRYYVQRKFFKRNGQPIDPKKKHFANDTEACATGVYVDSGFDYNAALGFFRRITREIFTSVLNNLFKSQKLKSLKDPLNHVKQYFEELGCRGTEIIFHDPGDNSTNMPTYCTLKRHGKIMCVGQGQDRFFASWSMLKNFGNFDQTKVVCGCYHN